MPLISFGGRGSTEIFETTDFDAHSVELWPFVYLISSTVILLQLSYSTTHLSITSQKLNQFKKTALIQPKAIRVVTVEEFEV